MLKPRFLLTQALIIGLSLTFLQAKEAFVCLTLEKGVYNLHYLEDTAASSWRSMPVSSNTSLKQIEDVDFNYMTSKFHFTSYQPAEAKGIWTASLTANLTDLTHSHTFNRKVSQPHNIQIYPEFDIAFIYDEGYELVLAFNLTETSQMYAKSYFQDVESVGPGFVLDANLNGLVAHGLESGKIYFSSLKDPKGEVVAKISENASEILAYDSSKSMLFYCLNGNIAAVQLNSTLNFSTNFPCSRIAAANGFIYSLNVTKGELVHFSYDSAEGFNASSQTTLRSLLALDQDAKIIAFKRYEFNGNETLKCTGKKCQHLCMPDSESKVQTACVCADFFTPNKTNSDKCDSERISKPGFTVMESAGSRNETNVYWLVGDPAVWTKRPYREQAMKINSHVIALTSDFDNRTSYAVEVRWRQIFTFLTDGTKIKLTPYNQISPAIKSIAFDWVGHNIIWYDPAFHWLRIAPIVYVDSPNHIPSRIDYKTVSVMSNLEGYSLALDSNAGYLFFLDLDGLESKIVVIRTMMDGSGAKKIASFDDDVFDKNIDDNNPDLPLPGSLTVDWYTKRVWVAFVNRIIVMNYNGTIEHSENVTFEGYNLTDSQVSSISVLNSTGIAVAVSSFSKTTTLFIYQASLDSSGKCCKELTPLQTRPLAGEFRGLSVYQQPPTPPLSLNCSSKCNYICTNINGSATCLCPDGLYWNKTQNKCLQDFSQPALPVMVYSRGSTLCYRSIEQVINAQTNVFVEEIEHCSETDDPYVFMEADDSESAIFAVQQRRSPFAPSIHHQQLKSNQRGIWGTLPNLNSPDEIENLHLGAEVTAMCFDRLARNLYVADKTSRTLVAMTASNSSYPYTVLYDVNIIGIAIDEIHRSMYWANFSEAENRTLFYQSDLMGGDQCNIATINGKIRQLAFVQANKTLIFLDDPARNQIGEINVDTTQILLGAPCPKNKLVIKNYSLVVPNVARFGVFEQTLFLVSSSLQNVFTSNTMGQTVIQKNGVLLAGTGPEKLALTSFTVVNPLTSEMFDGNNVDEAAFIDKCVEEGRGGCEQMCLADLCVCTLGMELLSDNIHCKPRLVDMAKGVVFATDAQHGKLFTMSLSAVKSSDPLLSANVSSLMLHHSSRPGAVAFDPIDGKVYYSDMARRLVFRIDPKIQMRSRYLLGDISEYLPVADSYALTIDPDNRLLIALPRNHHVIVALNMTQPWSNTGEANVQDIFKTNESTTFYAATMDLRIGQRWLYVLAVESSKTGNSIVIYRINPIDHHWNKFYLDTKGLTEASPDSQQPTKYELAVDTTLNRLYVSCNGSILSVSLLNISGSAEILASWNNYNGSLFSGIDIAQNFLMAGDWNSGSIHVFNTTSKQKLHGVGDNHFYGLDAIAVYDSSASAATVSPPPEATTPKATLPTTNTPIPPIPSQSTSSSSTKQKTSTSSNQTTAKTTGPSGKITTEGGKTTVSPSSTRKPTTASSATADTRKSEPEEEDESKTGLIVGVIIAVVVVGGVIVGLVVYFKRRSSSARFHRLDDAPAAGSYFRLEEDDARAGGLAPGSVSFRNPIYGMEASDLDTDVETNSRQRGRRSNALDIFTESDGGL